MARLGLGAAIEGGVWGSDIPGEFEAGERYCGACFVAGNCAAAASCVGLTGFALRLSDL